MRKLLTILVCILTCMPVWAKVSLISQTDKENYTIQLDNQLTVVYLYENDKRKDVYEKIPVLPNGKATIPKLGEIKVVDLTHEELITEIKSKIDPEIDVEVIIYRVSNNITVIGAVNKPGSYSINDMKTVYDGIGKAGGFTMTADKTNVRLIRQREDGSRIEHRINFPKQVFKAYEQGTGVGSELYIVKEGDLIYIPNSFMKQSGVVLLRLLQVATIGVISGVVSATVD